MITIINKVDLKPLNDVLEGRVKTPKYLIMSEHTKNAIDAQYKTTMPEKMAKLPKCVNFDIFKGMPIAICNAVPFGNVDITD